MANARVPVDLFNPGQVFACYGLLEANLALGFQPRAAFDWSDPAQSYFDMVVDGNTHPVAQVLAFLAEAEVHSLAPEGIDLSTEKWKVQSVATPRDKPFHYGAPDSPATLPARLEANGVQLDVDYWGDVTVRDNTKFWAGSGGYPGAAILRDALDLVKDQLASAQSDPFSVSAPQGGSFRLDWRRDYVPLGIGFSLNAHGNMTPLGYPLVEILAAIGLTHARPARPDRRDKLIYRYGVVGGDPLPPQLLRPALGCAELPFPLRTFRIQLDWPGKAGQARCITNTTEET